MNSPFSLPSNDDVRRAYGIPGDQKIDVKQVDELPDPSWVKKAGAILEQAADYFGVPTFLLKRGATILAVFFVPYWGPKVQEEVKSAIVISYDYWIGPFQKLPFQSADKPFDNYAIVTNTPNSMSQNLSFYESGYLTVGTSFIPISGSKA